MKNSLTLSLDDLVFHLSSAYRKVPWNSVCWRGIGRLRITLVISVFGSLTALLVRIGKHKQTRKRNKGWDSDIIDLRNLGKCDYFYSWNLHYCWEQKNFCEVLIFRFRDPLMRVSFINVPIMCGFSIFHSHWNALPRIVRWISCTDNM